MAKVVITIEDTDENKSVSVKMESDPSIDLEKPKEITSAQFVSLKALQYVVEKIGEDNITDVETEIAKGEILSRKTPRPQYGVGTPPQAARDVDHDPGLGV